ncbi:hypothetical protein [Actinoplanes philippinensis]|uniref:hypothetical protein n=1 Tax=Actinoplanes philippinensis TaxID=35752 RepID=UPI0033C74AA0
MSGIPDPWGSALQQTLLAACSEAERHHTAYEQTGRLSDLESAVALFSTVLKHAHHVDVRSTAMNGLGMSLWSRYERFGDPGDLDAAVGRFREALAMYPDEPTPAIPSFHANLAGVLRLRWRRTGDDTDLVASVAEARAAMAATGPGHPRRAWRLTNLADGLLALSVRHDDSSALAEAVDLLREAVRIAGPGDEAAGMRSNLAEALRLRYRSTGGRDRALLDEAVEHGRAALNMAPRHPLRPRFQSNLALVLLDRFAARRRPPDLSEAAGLAQQAVDATPEGHPNRAERLITLSGIRRMETIRGRSSGRLVELARDAVAATPRGHHLRSDALLGLGWAGVPVRGRGRRRRGPRPRPVPAAGGRPRRSGPGPGVGGLAVGEHRPAPGRPVRGADRVRPRGHVAAADRAAPGDPRRPGAAALLLRRSGPGRRGVCRPGR